MSLLDRPRYATLKGKRVLVTGGTGFIGSHLVKRLVASGAQVWVLARPTSSLARLAELQEQVEVIRQDLTDRSEVVRVVQDVRPQLVFHLAAEGVAPREGDTTRIINTNVLGLTYLLEALVGVPYERFVNTGSCFEYGNQQVPLTEDHPLLPLNEYAASKTMAWHLCHLHHRRHGKPIVTIRPFTCFGPHEGPERLIPSTIRSILDEEEIRITSGVQTRDYTYVEDIVEAYLLAAIDERALGQTLNIGTGIDYSVRDVVERIRFLMGSCLPIRVGALETRADEAWRLCCDSAKATRLLGWRPTVTFDEGLRRTIQWMSAQAARATVQGCSTSSS